MHDSSINKQSLHDGVQKDETFVQSKFFNAFTTSTGAVIGIGSGSLIGSVFPIPLLGTTIGAVVGGALGGTIGSLTGLGVGLGIQSNIEPSKLAKEKKVEKPVKPKVNSTQVQREEMRRHTQFHPNLWISYRGKVYDVTDYVVHFRSKHKDLMDSDEDLVCEVEEMAGKLDCTEEFERSDLCMTEKSDILSNCVGVLAK